MENMEELIKRKSKTIRLMKIEFEGEVGINEISSFRGAIIKKVGRKNILFHNHIDSDRFLYKYPLIQYKSIYKSPSIVCLNEGTDEIHNLFQLENELINIKGRDFDLELAKVDVHKVQLQTWDSKIGYKIFNWLPLNQANYKKFRLIENSTEQKVFLEKILIGNILSFAKGINWRIEEKIELSIDSIQGPFGLLFKGEKWFSFSALFSVNISIPQFIGLGRGVSHGFGTIKFSSSKKNDNE